MKRIGYLYDKIYDMDNLILAHKKAKRGKAKQKEVQRFILNEEDNLINLYHILANKEYTTSEYKIFTIFEGKERQIYQLPYKDRVVQWAIINIIGDILIKSFTKDTYSCIKGRGIHKCLNNLNKVIKNYNYCLKLDIKKFYPNVDNDILKSLLRKKFKDEHLLNLLDEIIDSNIGQPIGNLMSQYFGNFYLNYLTHYLKEELKIKDLFIYCDDVVILGNNKDELRVILNEIKEHLKINLKLELSNYQIYPIDSRGINFLGYISYKTHIKLRPEIKDKWIKMLIYYPNRKSKASFKGWLDHCNSINLQNKYLNGNKNKEKRVSKVI